MGNRSKFDFILSRSTLQNDNAVCSCQPIESIRDIGTILNPVWTMEAGYAAGKSWSLDEVENYLRNPTPFE